MSKPKFQIGDEVWHARTQTRPIFLQCLECMGKGYLTVILGDDSQVTIECDCCKRGWMGAQGNHQCHEHYESVMHGLVSGVEIDGDSFEYRIPESQNGCWIIKESDLFMNESCAKNRADKLSDERTKAATELHCLKHNKDRSWAWNVKYHRDIIRRSQKDIETHTEQLNYASVMAAKQKIEGLK